MMTALPSVSRLLGAALASAGLAFAAAPAAQASEVTVGLKVSTQWAVVGFPVTATVTATGTGTISLSQVRNDGWHATGSGYCGHPGPLIERLITNRPITASTPIKVTIQPSSLAYFGGDLINPGTGCWDQATPFDRLKASFSNPGDSSVGTIVAFRRVL